MLLVAAALGKEATGGRGHGSPRASPPPVAWLGHAVALGAVPSTAGSSWRSCSNELALLPGSRRKVGYRPYSAASTLAAARRVAVVSAAIYPCSRCSPSGLIALNVRALPAELLVELAAFTTQGSPSPAAAAGRVPGGLPGMLGRSVPRPSRFAMANAGRQHHRRHRALTGPRLLADAEPQSPLTGGSAAQRFGVG